MGWCYRVFTDRASGSLDERVELAKLFDQVRPGDTVVVWRLDRLGRSLRHLIDTVNALSARSGSCTNPRHRPTLCIRLTSKKAAVRKRGRAALGRGPSVMLRH